LAIIVAYGSQILDTKLLQTGFWVRVAIQKLEKSKIDTVDSGEGIGLMVCLSLLKYQLLGKSCHRSLGFGDNNCVWSPDPGYQVIAIRILGQGGDPEIREI